LEEGQGALEDGGDPAQERNDRAEELAVAAKHKWLPSYPKELEVLRVAREEPGYNESERTMRRWEAAERGGTAKC
jgi:hypothetical protein